MNKISCIICAYNEEKRIPIVLTALKLHPLINEVIVVNDGSTDKTEDIVKQFPFVKLISHKKNAGKSKAMATGIKEASNDILMFLDADILSITPLNIEELAKPVLENKSDVSISIRKNSLLIYRIMGLDFVSGERVIHKKHLINQIDEIEKLPNYGIEVFINRLIIKKRLTISVINWDNVLIETKTAKIGFVKGIIGELLMIRDINKVIPFREMIFQNYQLLKLTKNN